MTPLLVIIGPSGSGKSTVARELVRRDCIRLLPTWTTRPPRADEIGAASCPEHRFVNDDEFERMERTRFFLASGKLLGLDHRYGLLVPPTPYPGLIDAVIIRAAHVERLRALVDRQLLVYQVENHPESALSRVAARGLPAAEVEARTAKAAEEIEAGRRVADRVFVNSGTVGELMDAVVGALRWDAAVYQQPLPAARSPRREWVKVRRSQWQWAGAALACVVAIAGLAVVAFLVAAGVGMSNYGSNK